MKTKLNNEQHKQYEKSLLERINILIQQRDELLEKVIADERLDMMCRMYGDTYDDALEFKEQRDELLEVAKYSLKIVETFPCEGDTYNGVKCNKHNWKKKLERAIQKVEGDK